MNMGTVLITGASGMLGSTLVPMLKRNGHNVKTHAKLDSADYQIDLTRRNEAFDLLEQARPDTIINLVGLTDVDLCETKPSLAFLINARTVENIVTWIKTVKKTCHLVHLSTDQVFDGEALHNEEDVVLKNYYAFSKYTGELMASMIPSTILRTNFFGLSHCKKRQSLTDWIFCSMFTGKQIQAFADVYFNPLSMETLGKVIELVLQKNIPGTFNVGSREGMSKADFAFNFISDLGLSSEGLTRISIGEATFLKAYRPRNMQMNCNKFETAFGMSLPTLRDEIRNVAKEYDEKK